MNIDNLKKYVKEHEEEIGVYNCWHLNDYGEDRYEYRFGKDGKGNGELIGWKIKNYKLLCEILEEEVKSSNSKKAQLKRWQRYFQIERTGNAYIVKLIKDASVDSDNGSFELTFKKRPLLYFGKNKFESGMKEVFEMVDEDFTFNKEYITDLNEYILITDLWGEEYKCYTENDLAKLFQYINFNYSRYTGRRNELSQKSNISKETIDKFYQLTKKSYTRIIENSIKKIEEQGWITTENVLCGFDVHILTEGYYTQTEYGDDELKYRVKDDIKTGYKRELNEKQQKQYESCIMNAVEKMSYRNKGFIFKTPSDCKRCNYPEWIKTINEETSLNMGLLYVKENYKIKLTEKAKEEFFDTVVYDVYENSINCLYQNVVYALKLKRNALYRFTKKEEKKNSERLEKGEEPLSNEEMWETINNKIETNNKLIRLLISLKKEDIEEAKKILYRK